MNNLKLIASNKKYRLGLCLGLLLLVFAAAELIIFTVNVNKTNYAMFAGFQCLYSILGAISVALLIFAIVTRKNRKWWDFVIPGALLVLSAYCAIESFLARWVGASPDDTKKVTEFYGVFFRVETTRYDVKNLDAPPQVLQGKSWTFLLVLSAVLITLFCILALTDKKEAN